MKKKKLESVFLFRFLNFSCNSIVQSIVPSEKKDSFHVFISIKSESIISKKISKQYLFEDSIKIEDQTIHCE